MNKYRGGVPGLDLLAEDNREPRGILFGKEGKYGGVDCLEHLGGEGANIIQVCVEVLMTYIANPREKRRTELQGINCFGIDIH